MLRQGCGVEHCRNAGLSTAGTSPRNTFTGMENFPVRAVEVGSTVIGGGGGAGCDFSVPLGFPSCLQLFRVVL